MRIYYPEYRVPMRRAWHAQLAEPVDELGELAGRRVLCRREPELPPEPAVIDFSCRFVEIGGERYTFGAIRDLYNALSAGVRECEAMGMDASYFFVL